MDQIPKKTRVLADITLAEGNDEKSTDDGKSESKEKKRITGRDISKSKPFLRLDERNIWNKFCDFANKRDNFTGTDVLSYFHLISKNKKFKVQFIFKFMTKLGCICFEQTGIDIWEDFKVLPNSGKEMAGYLKKAFPNEKIEYMTEDEKREKQRQDDKRYLSRKMNRTVRNLH